MSRHANRPSRWLDTVAVRREPEIAWPTGADLAYYEQLRAMNDTPTVRMEARA